MSLISKYHTAAPRYTSYPTVPYWENNLTVEQWKDHLKRAFVLANETDGISLYIHLPYCESLCTYCACNTRITVNHKVEEPYIDAVIKEWKLYLSCCVERPRIKTIHLGGGTPTFFSPKNLQYLISSILADCNLLAHHDFSFEAHPANTTEEHLKVLNQLGFNRISFGIQDFDPIVQEAINRYQSIEEVETIVNAARRNGYTSINFDLVYGLPFQKKEGLQQTLDAVIQLQPDRIAFYSYAHVPWIKPGQRKFTDSDVPKENEKAKLAQLGNTLLTNAGYHTIAMDHYALSHDALYQAQIENRLHRNFMGYTEHPAHLLLALGVSSISDAGSAFAQNIKTVEPYIACVNDGNWPLQKGHTLDGNDFLFRKHILDIMCHLYTSWTTSELENSAFTDALERLSDLEKDHLVIIKENTLQVTDAGRPFLRNICLCFDEYFQRTKVRENMFSSTT